MDRLLNKVPNMAPDGPLGTEKKGPLTVIGDPLGQVLGYVTKPIGLVTGKIGNPNGEALLAVRKQAEREGKYTDDDNHKPDSELPGGERIGGNAQNGENPLGL
ncbi:hypothetical protein AC579_10462 [Pseudocercospora musae]|uniref:Uncharacterized protein n=1 Tax=Pseudocercospora musae TaxID=113226 RepID=A0A139IDV4_9PEZI|nr:hypothetical protein AC579_10462 [Pseudocercospora musae]